MEFEPCKACEGKGYIEMGAYDPDETCEECNGFGKVIKRLTLEELRDQFEEVNKYDFDKQSGFNPQAYYENFHTEECWLSYLSCAKANNILREG